MKVGVAGQGAFGQKHLEGIAKIPGIEVITLTGGNQAATEEVAKKFNIPHWTGDLAESLTQPGLEAMILATPTQMHARQGEQCMRAGKHVQIEIPIADTLADSARLVKVQQETKVVCMGGHTRRFNPRGHRGLRSPGRPGPRAGQVAPRRAQRPRGVRRGRVRRTTRLLRRGQGRVCGSPRRCPLRAAIALPCTPHAALRLKPLDTPTWVPPGT